MSKHIDAELGLAYLEGRLDPARRAKLERHLAECVACQTQLHQHQATHSLLQKSGQAFQAMPVQTPAWSTLRSRQAKWTGTQTIRRTTLQFAAVGAVVVLFVVLLLTYQPDEPTIEPAASSEPDATTTMEGVITTTPLANLSATPVNALPLPTHEATPGFNSTLPLTATTNVTPLTTVTPGLLMSSAFVSASGQVAFTRDGMLYVTSNDSEMVEIARLAEPLVGDDGPVVHDAAAWSPDGHALLFFTTPTEGELYQAAIWQDGTVTLLSQLVNQPLPAVPFTSYRWSPDGSQILLTSSSRLQPESEWTSGIWLATLDRRDLTLVVEARELIDTTWLDDERFMLTLDCGRDCAIIMAYNEQTQPLWKAYEEEGHATSGLFVLAADRQHLVNLNTVAQTVDLVDTTTGAITPLWTVPEGRQFASIRPILSPDGQQMAFTLLEGDTPVLVRLGLDGQVKGQRQNSTVLGWRPEGGLVVAEALDETQNQLVYWGVDGAIDRIFVQPKQFRFTGGQWNADGRYFVYSAVDENIGASYLYLWQPESGVPFLIQAVASSRGFSQFAWLATANGFYFNLAEAALWFYDSQTGQITDLNRDLPLNLPDS